MISYEIQAPNKTPPRELQQQPVLTGFQEFNRRASEAVATRRQSGLMLGKLEYAQFLNEYVYPYFKKGTLVTLRSLPVVLGTAPAFIARVAEIQEIHHHANMDIEQRQPRCVGVELISSKITAMGLVWYPPIRIRVLHPGEELEFDKLRNQKAAADASAATGRDDQGQEVSEGGDI